MLYQSILNNIYSIIMAILGVFGAYYIVFYIMGIFQKKFPKTDKKLNYGILICARNEEKVIGNLIKSIRDNNYDQDKLKIYVMAHNCTDRTAYYAEQAGATKVYSYTNDKERTKGFALKKLIELLKEDELLLENDGYYVFDADNVVSSNYFEKMNDAFVYYDKQRVISSFRNSKNFAENRISACYGVHFAFESRFLVGGRTVVGCSGNVQGTGFVMNTDLIKDGWNYLSIAEDCEFTADLLLKNQKVAFCNDAMFYDEQPIDIKTMWKQKERWFKGTLIVFATKFKQITKKIFSVKDKKNKISTIDFLVKIVPYSLITFFVLSLYIVASFLEPIFNDVNAFNVLMRLIPMILEMLLMFYMANIITPIIVFIFERKRMPKMNLLHKLKVVFYYPIFKMYELALAVEVFFNKNIGWQQIKHANETSIEDIKNGKVKISKKEAKVSVFTKVKNKALNVETADLQEDAVNIKNSH